MAADVTDEIRRIAGSKFDAAKVELLTNELFPGENVDVPDPYFGLDNGFVTVYQMLDEACTLIAEKLLKEDKSKLQASIQGDKVRVTGKKRDELQEAITLLKKSKIKIALQFENFRD